MSWPGVLWVGGWPLEADHGVPEVPYVTPAVPALRKDTSIVDASPTAPAIGL